MCCRCRADDAREREGGDADRLRSLGQRGSSDGHGGITGNVRVPAPEKCRHRLAESRRQASGGYPRVDCGADHVPVRGPKPFQGIPREPAAARVQREITELSSKVLPIGDCLRWLEWLPAQSFTVIAPAQRRQYPGRPEPRCIGTRVCGDNVNVVVHDDGAERVRKGAPERGPYARRQREGAKRALSPVRASDDVKDLHGARCFKLWATGFPTEPSVVGVPRSGGAANPAGVATDDIQLEAKRRSPRPAERGALTPRR